MFTIKNTKTCFYSTYSIILIFFRAIILILLIKLLITGLSRSILIKKIL